MHGTYDYRYSLYIATRKRTETQMARVTHLNKSGSGMASKTACGRNILRTPMSTDWAGFKGEQRKCNLCAVSGQAALNARRDMDSAEWEPEDADAWKRADDALIAARRASQA